MMRTKQLSIILFALGIAVLLSQWGTASDWLARVGTDAGVRPKKIVEWSGSGSPDFELRRASEFEKRHPDTQVTLYFRVSGRLSDTLFVSFLGGNPPDLMSVTLTEMPDMIANGMLLPLDELLEEAVEEDPDFIEKRVGGEQDLIYFTANPNDPRLARDESGNFLQPLQAARLLHTDGKLIGFGGTMGISTLTYNKRVFRNAARMFPDAGLVDERGEPIPPATWEEFIDKAKLITEYGKQSGEGVYGVVVQGRTPRDFMRGIEPLSATAGSTGFDFNGEQWIEGMARPVGRFEFDSPAMLGAFRLMMMLRADGSVLPGTSSREFEDCRVALAEGRAAMLLDGWHAAMIGVERVPWASDDIGSAPVPVPYLLNHPETQTQRESIQNRLGIPVERGASPRGIVGGGTSITTGSEYPETAWDWMHSTMDRAVVQQNTRRGSLPSTTESVANIDDPEWFPYRYQRQAWEAYQGYRHWPQAPDRPQVVGQDHANAMHEAFLVTRFDKAPEERIESVTQYVNNQLALYSKAKNNELGENALLSAFLATRLYQDPQMHLESVTEDVKNRLSRYTEAVNDALAERVLLGNERPEMWTFENFDPVDPTSAYDQQRRASQNPEHAAQIQALIQQLPEEYRQVDKATFYRFETSASAWALLWIPGLLAGIVGMFLIHTFVASRRSAHIGFIPTMQEARRKWYAYVFILPGVLLMIGFVIYPSLYQFYLAAHTGNGIGPLRYIGLDHFRRIFYFSSDGWDAIFWTKVLPNTALYMAVVTTAQVGLGLLIASLLNLPLKAANLSRSLFFIPLAVSLAAVAVVFLGLLGGEDSAVNGVLEQVGLSDLPFWLGLTPQGVRHDWLGSPDTDLYAVMLVGIWHGLPYNIILLLAGLQSVDPQLYEAAKVDGAGPLSRFRHITIPDLMPILIIIIFHALIGAARAFGPIFILTEGGKNHSSEVVSTYIYKWGFTKPPDQQPDIGYASALGLVYAGLLAIFLFANVWVIARRWKKRIQIDERPPAKPTASPPAGPTAVPDAMEVSHA